MAETEKLKFAYMIWDFNRAQSEFEEELEEAGFAIGKHYQSIGWDEYDISIEFYKVNEDVRLTEEQQRIIYEAGFGKIYVNHKDGWETHYHWGLEDVEAIKATGKFLPKKGWRRRWIADPSANTTRSVGAKPSPNNAGYYEISEWPDAWNIPSCKEWLKSGFIKVVGQGA